jgi:hypothetical protein
MGSACFANPLLMRTTYAFLDALEKEAALAVEQCARVGPLRPPCDLV